MHNHARLRLGRRTRNATGIAFLYDGANAVQELSGSTVTANLLTGGVDEIFTRTDSGGTRNFLGDALGSTLALTDSTGAVQTQYSYEPFGKTTATGSASSSTFQYTGRENDGTGMYYYRARYYSPTLGRFISEDPLGFGGGDINLYAYAGNSPTNLGDPSGQSSIGGGFDDSFFNNLAKRKPKPRPHCPSGLTCNAAGWPVEPGINLDADALNILAALMSSGLSAGALLDGAASKAGEYSVWDASGGLLGINTDVTADEFIANLEANGYTATSRAGSNGTTTVLTNGQGSTYSVYMRTSTGQSGAQYIGPISPTIKINLGK